MNKLLLIAVLLCFVAINARHYGERTDSETYGEDDSQTDFRRTREHSPLPRHRKRRWQNYGYDYQPPTHYADRRDYNTHQDLMPQIYRLLEDISTYIRRTQQAPPPPPQPIYIPYPVPFYVPRYIGCKPKGSKVNITDRFPELEDVNQNWGFVTNDLPDEIYDDSEGMRPISFEPIKPKQDNMKRPMPPVEHGSTQSNSALTTQAPAFGDQQSSSNKMPSMCYAAIISCCSIKMESAKSDCFNNLDCPDIYSKGGACTSKSIKEALQALKTTYAPVK